jgi:Ca-activated chloride channel homolog
VTVCGKVLAGSTDSKRWFRWCSFTLENEVELPAVALHIGPELRTQYVLGYRPEDMPKDGKWHKIEVQLRLPKKLLFLRAHAETGYYAPAE